MNKNRETIEARLSSDHFPYRVAVFSSHLEDLGTVIEVHAFDVPTHKILAVSHRLNRLLAFARTEPMAVGTAFTALESAERATAVPAHARWWTRQPEPATRRA